MTEMIKIRIAGGTSSIGQHILKNYRKISPLETLLRDIQRSQYPKPKQNKRDIYKKQ